MQRHDSGAQKSTDKEQHSEEIQVLRQRCLRLKDERDELLNLARSDSGTFRMPDWLPTVISRSPSLVLCTDIEGNVEYANPAFLRTTGYGLSEIIGKNIFTPDCTPLSPSERTRMRQKLDKGQDWRGLLRYWRKDGACYWLDAVFIRHTNPDGSASLIGVMEDVTERLTSQTEEFRQGRELSMLYRIANTVGESERLDELFPAIHTILLEHIDAPNFYIALLDRHKDRIIFPYFSDEKDDIYKIDAISSQTKGSLTLDVIRQGQPLIVRRKDFDHKGKSRREDISGLVGTPCAIWLGVPLMVEGRIIGAMAIQDYNDEQHFDEKDAELLVSISGQVALSIERKRIEDALRRSEERYRIVSDSAFGLETWCSPEEHMLYVSPSCERITGYSVDDFMGDPLFIENLIHRDDLPLWKGFMAKKNHNEEDFLDFRIFRKDGRIRWLSVVCRLVEDDCGASLGIRCSMRDITDRKNLEIRLSYQALHDNLTGLANRELALDRISQMLERSRRREKYHYAVVYLDFDRFKIINDSLGHSFGDAVLREAGMRLLHCVRSLDTVSRFGGDEFILLLDELESPREAIRAVGRVKDALAKPLTIGSESVRLTACFGIVLSNPEYTSAEEILQNATIALHGARHYGERGRIKVFSPRMRELAEKTLYLEKDLRRGIENGEFHVLYQPIFAIETSKVTGFEALCRWAHPQRGEVMPGDFIPLAEETGDIIDLGLLVLREACTTLASWQKTFPDGESLVMSVNLSAVQFSQPSLVDQISCIIEETGITPACLKLEITETAVMKNAEGALTMLQRLKALGVQLSIDDFGTGYCSLSYLLQFPVNTLKIDRSFIVDMTDGSRNEEIVRLVTTLARTIGLDVIAEGVERPQQVETLKKMHCEFVQGFHFSKPLPRDAAEKLLAKSSPN